MGKMSFRGIFLQKADPKFLGLPFLSFRFFAVPIRDVSIAVFPAFC
jgi:hypothetical protein